MVIFFFKMPFNKKKTDHNELAWWYPCALHFQLAGIYGKSSSWGHSSPRRFPQKTIEGSFCTEVQIMNHFLYISKFVWSLTAHVLGANCHPGSFEQLWTWMAILYMVLRNGKQFHMVGVPWFFWLYRTQEKWRMIECLACSFISLQNVRHLAAFWSA